MPRRAGVGERAVAAGRAGMSERAVAAGRAGMSGRAGVARRAVVAERAAMSRLAAVSVVAGVAVIGSAAGCSNLSVARTIDAKQVAGQISQSIGTTFTIAKPTVHCPGGIRAEAGATFDCTATLENQPLTIHVRVNDSKGFYTPTLAQAVVVVSKIATLIKSDPAQSKVACDNHTLLVKRPGETFACTVNSGGGTQTVKLTVQDLNGTLTYQTPTTTVPSAPPPSG